MKKLYISLLILISIANIAKADHVMGADITYRLIDTNSGKYRFRVTLYRACSGIPSFINTKLSIRKLGFSGDIQMTKIGQNEEVTPICLPPDVPSKPVTNCPGQTPVLANGIKGVERHIYEVEYVMGKNIGWSYVGYSECCRNVEITTGQSWQTFWIQAAINTNYINSSTVFLSPPIPYWCRLKVNTYNHGSVDTVDPRYITVNNKTVIRDSIGYELICPFAAEAANLNSAANLQNPCTTFASPLNKTNFLFTVSGVQFNQLTGSYTCVPSVLQDAVMAIAVIEYRAVPNPNGIGYTRVKVGYVCRDVQITVRDICDPITSPGIISDSLVNSNYITSEVIDICGANNSKATFKIVGAFGQFIKSNIIEKPNSASVFNFKYKETIINSNGTDTLFGTISFDSTKGIGSEKFTLQVFYCTSIGSKVSKFYTLILNFRPAVKVKKKILYYCVDGKPVRCFVSGGTKYRWWPKKNIVGASGIDSLWVDLAPDSTRTYEAKAIDGIDSTQSCSIIDSVRVIVVPKFNYTLSPKVSDVCLHDQISILLNTQISDTPYKYSWVDPTIGSMYTANGERTLSISSPKIIALNDATYKVEIENRFECVLVDSIRVNLKGVRPVASGLSARSSVCPGDTTMLSVNIIPKTCGPTLYSCAKNFPIITVQSGTPQSYPTSCISNSPASCHPNPFSTVSPGNSVITRIIYKKSELVNAGLKPGIIKAISFSISNLLQNSIDKFEIKMGSTNLTNAVTSIAPTFSVYGPTTQPVIASWNKFSFSRGFDWDGNSNIIIETYASSNNSFLNSNQMLTMTSVAGNEVAFKYSDVIGVSAEKTIKPFSSGGPTASKPMLQIEFCSVDSTPTNYLNTIWTPTNLISSLTNPKAIGTLTQRDSVFIATVGTTQCFDTAVVKINLPAFKIFGSGGKIICRQGGVFPNINLSSTISGGSPTTVFGWTSIPSSGGIVSPNSQNTLVTPTGIGVYKYIVSATDGPCMTTDTVTIVVNDSIIFNLSIDSPLCTSNTGKLCANLPAGTSAINYKFLWTSNGVQNPASDTNKVCLSNLVSGNYSLLLKLKSDQTCQGTASAILAPKIITLNVSDTTSGIKCSGGSADSLWSRVSSPFGSGNYKYIWTPGTAGDTFYKMTNKLAGNYTTNVVDRITGCLGTTLFSLTQPNPLVITLDKLIHVKCKGNNTGEIKVSASGGTLNGGSYIYQWSSIEKGQTIPNFNEYVSLYADSIRVTVTDINGCTVSAGYRINEPAKGLQIDSIKKVNATTLGGCDGIATVYVSGGTPNYKYSWAWNNPSGAITNGPKSALFDILGGRCKGNNCVTVSDNEGCIDTACIYIQDIVCNMKYFKREDSVKCNGQATGKIHFGAIDSINHASTNWYKYTLYLGNDTLSIPLQNSQLNNHYLAGDTALFSGLQANIYTVRIRTSKGCDTFVNFIDIPQNPKIYSNDTTIMPSCFGLNDGEVHIKITQGAFKPYMFDFGAGYSLDSFDKAQKSGRNFQVNIKDRLSCVQPHFYKIDTPIIIAVSIDNPVITNCRGDATGTAVINVTSTTPSVLATVSYMFKPGSNVDTTSNLLAGLNAGTKTFNVHYTNSANGNRCPFPYTFNVNSPDTLVITPRMTDPRCHNTLDGLIEGKLLTGQAGTPGTTGAPYNYELYKGSTLISSTYDPSSDTIAYGGLDSGIYTIKVFDGKGCSNTQIVTLNKPDTFRIGFSGIVDASCITSNNGEINISSFTGGNTTAAGAYGITWSRIDLLAGNNIDIPQPQYTNNPNPKTLIGLSTYTAIATDSKGCTASRSTTIDTQYVLRITKLTVDSAKCFGSSDGTITINSVAPSTAPGLTYTFSSPNSVANVLTEKAGNYTVTVNDAVGCVTTGSATIEQPTDIVILGKVYDAKCFGEPEGRIKIKISGGTPAYKTIVWGSGANMQFTDSATNLPAGDHTVTVIDAHNCPKQQTFTVLQPVEFKVSIDSKKDVSCFAAADGEIKLKTSGGVEDFSYVWNNSLPATKNQINLGPNTYRVTATDATGCTTTASQEIKEPLKLEFDPIKVDSVSCPGYNDGVIDISPKGGTISALKGYEFSIDGGLTFVSGNKFTGLYAKDYNVALRDNNGCIASRRVTVYQPETLFITAKRDTLHDTLTMGQTSELSFTKSNNAIYISNISWTPSAALSCADCAKPIATPYITTLYEVEVRYTNNCIVKSKINVPVYDPLDFFVPSAFTPGNGDGLNDQLMVFGNGIKKSRLMIFNRWGEKVFESDHITKGWDGKFKGESQPSGVYSFHAEVEYLNGEKRTKKGSLTLMR